MSPKQFGDISMKYFLFISFFLLSKILFASAERDSFEEAYLREHSTGQIICIHPDLKQGASEHILKEYIRTDFQLEDFSFSITVKRGGDVLMEGDGGYQLEGSVNNQNLIYFEFKKLNQVTYEINKRFNLLQMQCRVGMWYDTPIKIESNKVHINVHPHPYYDPTNFTAAMSLWYLMNKNYKSYILLDNFSFQGSQNLNYFIDRTAVELDRDQKFTRPNFDVPESANFYVAPAGHIFYQFYTNDVEVLYTGGNINYCIANNLLFLIDGFLQYNTSGSLVVKFDLDAIVAQRGGWIGPRFKDGVSKYLGIVVKDAFRKFPNLKEDYHEELLDYLVDKKFGNKRNFFKSVSLQYISDGKVKTRNISGNGKGHYDIRLEFLNE